MLFWGCGWLLDPCRLALCVSVCVEKVRLRALSCLLIGPRSDNPNSDCNLERYDRPPLVCVCSLIHIWPTHRHPLRLLMRMINALSELRMSCLRSRIMQNSPRRRFITRICVPGLRTNSPRNESIIDSLHFSESVRCNRPFLMSFLMAPIPLPCQRPHPPVRNWFLPLRPCPVFVSFQTYGKLKQSISLAGICCFLEGFFLDNHLCKVAPLESPPLFLIHLMKQCLFTVN